MHPIDGQRTDLRARLNRQEEFRVNPDASRSQNRPIDPPSSGTAPKTTERARDTERRFHENTFRFEDIMRGKAHEQRPEAGERRTTDVKQENISADDRQASRPGNLYAERLNETTRISDAQIVEDSQKDVQQKQNIRGDNTGYYSQQFREAPGTRETFAEATRFTDVNRFQQNAAVAFREDGAASYLRFLKNDQAPNVRLHGYA